MPVVVQKYGGSSVSDVDKIRRVAERVVEAKREGFDVVAVVSAMGKTTDELLTLATQVDPNPPRRELDMLLTTGERVSMALLSMAIQRLGCDAISFTGSQSGIITNDRHFDARIIEVRPHRVEDELARGRVVIVAGYQGMSYRREITTLGRGGSDTTALAMAAALKAERAEIYSDVDGVYTADPRAVPDAVHLPELTYREMQEMSDAGAKVLHSKAIQFAEDNGISIHARATFKPGRETRVHGGASPCEGALAVVGQDNVCRIVTRGGGAAARTAMRVAQRSGTLPREIRSSGDGAAFLVVTAHSPDWSRTRDELERELGPSVSIEEGFATVSVIGRCGTDEENPAARALRVLEQQGVLSERLSASETRASALLRGPALAKAVRELHALAVRRP